MTSHSAEDYVTVHVARDEGEARLIVIMLCDNGIPATAEPLPAANTFTPLDSRPMSVLTMRKDAMRARSLIDARRNSEQYRKMSRAFQDTQMVVVPEGGIPVGDAGQPAGAAGKPADEQGPPDTVLICRAPTPLDAHAIVAYLEDNDVPAMVIDENATSLLIPVYTPGVRVPANKAGAARELMKKYFGGPTVPPGWENVPGAYGEGTESPGTYPEAESSSAAGGADGAENVKRVVARLLPVLCGAVLLWFAATRVDDPTGILLIGGPALIILGWLCYAEPWRKRERKGETSEDDVHRV